MNRINILFYVWNKIEQNLFHFIWLIFLIYMTVNVTNKAGVGLIIKLTFMRAIMFYKHQSQVVFEPKNLFCNLSNDLAYLFD